jgi:hypothetical protein
MITTLITAGCSFTKDHYQNTWADFLAQELDCNLLNIGARGAGLDFVSKRLMIALNNLEPKNALVGILLPSMDRFDCYVDSAHAAKNHLLGISSWQNGSDPLFVTLDGELSRDHGYCLNGGEPRGIKKHWYKYYYSSTAAYINYWFNIVNIQNFLMLKGFNYFFSSAYDLDQAIEQDNNQDGQEIEYHTMKQLVDFDQFILYQNQQGFLSFVRDGQYDIVKNHPTVQAHYDYVRQVILPGINK